LYQAKTQDELISHFPRLFRNTDLVLLKEELMNIYRRQNRYQQIMENYTMRGKKITVLLQWSVYPGSEATMDRVVVSTIDITQENKANRLQSAILKISQDADEVDTINQLYKSVHETLKTMMPANNFYIASYESGTRMISFPYFVDQYDTPPPPRPFGHGWTEIVINSGKPVLISENMVRQMRDEEITDIGSEPVCWLGVPLIVKGDTIGVLVVQSYDHDTNYTPEDRDLLMIMANQIAMAINEKQTEDRLVYTSTHDELTGLYNRAYYETEISRLSAGRDEPVGVIMMDIDGLKAVNDHFGHMAGDALIKASAEIIRTAFRVNDVVARIGGDEVAVLLPNSDMEVVNQALQRIQSLADHFNASQSEIQVGLSMGGSTTSKQTPLQAAIIQADQEMYKVKAIRKQSAGGLIR
jgi:diguanylate cyclase (GGDEF)-like protein